MTGNSGVIRAWHKAYNGERFGDYAKMRQRFDRKLLLRLSLAIVGIMLLAFTVVVPTFRDFRLAHQNLEDIRDFRQLLDTATYFSTERGFANTVMEGGLSASDDARRRLYDHRSRIDTALSEMAGSSRSSHGSMRHTIPTAMLDGVSQQLTTARAKADRIAGLTRGTVSLEEFQEAVEAMFETSNRFHAIVAFRAQELLQQDSRLAAPVLVSQMLSDLREYGGRMCSQIIAPIATGQEMPLSNIVAARRSQGRLLELWQLISAQTTLYKDPLLQQSYADIDSQFLSAGMSLVDTLIAEGRAGGEYSLTAGDFIGRYVPTMRPLETYRSAFLDTVITEFERLRADALMTLLAVALITFAVLAILIGFILSIRTHIFRPLMQAHEEVVRLIEDRPHAVQAPSSQAGEIRSLFQAIEVLQDKWQERKLEATALRIEAETDGLTGLLNRRTLDRHARSMDGYGLCLILIDIDHFKRVNDVHGHPSGDAVLIQTAKLLQILVGDGGIAARFGGEEFAILIKGWDLPAALLLARQVRLALRRQIVMTPDGVELTVTASFGVAKANAGDSWAGLISVADEALYRAKAEGRDRVRFTRSGDKGANRAIFA